MMTIVMVIAYLWRQLTPTNPMKRVPVKMVIIESKSKIENAVYIRKLSWT